MYVSFAYLDLSSIMVASDNPQLGFVSTLSGIKEKSTMTPFFRKCACHLFLFLQTNVCSHMFCDSHLASGSMSPPSYPRTVDAREKLTFERLYQVYTQRFRSVIDMLTNRDQTLFLLQCPPREKVQRHFMWFSVCFWGTEPTVISVDVQLSHASLITFPSLAAFSLRLLLSEIKYQSFSSILRVQGKGF